MAARDAAVAMILRSPPRRKWVLSTPGTVARIVDFGAFVNILPGKDGWCTFPDRQ